MAADSLLYHVPPVELQTWVYCLHSHRCQVHLTASYVVLLFLRLLYVFFDAMVPPRLFNVWISKLCYVFSYAEVRAERRRAFGFEELSPPEIAPSSVKVWPQWPFYTECASNAIESLLICWFLFHFLFSFRRRSCTWTFAPRWTLRGKETAAHVRYPPTAPGSPPTQRCQILHVSHLLFPKVLTHSTAGQCVPNSCIHMISIAVNETNWKNVIFFLFPLTSSTVSWSWHRQ